MRGVGPGASSRHRATGRVCTELIDPNKMVSAWRPVASMYAPGALDLLYRFVMRIALPVLAQPCQLLHSRHLVRGPLFAGKALHAQSISNPTTFIWPRNDMGQEAPPGLPRARASNRLPEHADGVNIGTKDVQV